MKHTSQAHVLDACLSAPRFEHILVDKVVTAVLEALRPSARQGTTHGVGLAERVEALVHLLPEVRPLRPGLL